MEQTNEAGAPVSDAITSEEAAKNRILIKEDIAKYEQMQARFRAQIAELDVYIAECRTALADIDRREAGVSYPPPNKKPEQAPGGKGAPAMGKIVGGK